MGLLLGTALAKAGRQPTHLAWQNPVTVRFEFSFHFM